MDLKEKRPRLVHVSTVPEFFWSFFQGQVEYMEEKGFEVHLICSSGDLIADLLKWPATIHTVEIKRAISPISDIITIWKLTRLLRRLRPDILHAHTSKAGLVSMAAARLAKVPTSFFTIHGFRWAGKEGLSRFLIKAANRVTVLLADRVLCVSRSNLEVGLAEDICTLETTGVLCDGSINGVDSVNRFNPANIESSSDLRSGLGIPDKAFLFGFVGRIVRDKGVEEIAGAWKMIRKEYADAHLMMVGKIETGDLVSDAVIDAFRSDPRVHMAGFQKDIPRYLHVMDALLLPSYREGFPVTPLEASAMELPVVASRIPGCVDAVIDNETGLLVEPGDVNALAEAMRRLLEDRGLGKRLGKNGRQYVMEHFEPERIWKALLEEYQALLRPGPDPVFRGPVLGLALKRFIDLVIAVPVFMITLPLSLIIALLIYITLGLPVLYRDRRAGKRGDAFWFLKFRTMTNACDAEGRPLPDEERLTRLGRILRSASLDELPQLINVIKGEMSLVGPRPLPVKYMERYDPRQALRHHMKPGITGWVAVNYRGKDKTWEEKLEQDAWYVEHWGLGLDLKILFLTFRALFRRLALNRSGETTSEEFMGKRPAGRAEF